MTSFCSRLLRASSPALGLISALLVPAISPAQAATVESEPSGVLPEWIVEFVYTGAPATWIVPPATVDVAVDLRGALGGWSNSGPDDPGSPGRARATLTASPGTAWQINVGGKGSVGTGGFNGGGDSNLSIGFIGGGGGGATDLRIGGTSLAERRLVAGGGAGAGDNQYGRGGGHGGGLEGTDGLAYDWWSPESYGRGGTQLSGGAGGTSNFDGQPGVAGDGGDGVQGGGGGGGWYGGGGGGGYSPVNYTSGGGGGGSGYGPPDTVFDTGTAGDPPVWGDFNGYGRLTFRATHAAGLAVTVTGSQIYGGEPTYSVIYEGLLEGDDATEVTGTVSCTTDATATSPVGDGYTVTDCSGLSSVDYALFYVEGGLTVTATTPAAPMIGAATGGNASASVSFTAPTNDGGSAITGYTEASDPGGFAGSCASSPCAVSGLTNGTVYTFTVTATNEAGTSSASLPSNSATPTLPTYTVGGSLSGLASGYSVTLQNNGGDDQALTNDGNFTFTAQDDGTGYAVAVTSQPQDPTQYCSVSNGTGTLSGADVIDVGVSCRTNMLFSDGFESLSDTSVGLN